VNPGASLRHSGEDKNLRESESRNLFFGNHPLAWFLHRLTNVPHIHVLRLSFAIIGGFIMNLIDVFVVPLIVAILETSRRFN